LSSGIERDFSVYTENANNLKANPSVESRLRSRLVLVDQSRGLAIFFTAKLRGVVMDRLQVLSPLDFLFSITIKKFSAANKKATEIILRAMLSETEPEWGSVPESVRDVWREAWEAELNKF
jgi:hypothetical protein